MPCFSHEGSFLRSTLHYSEGPNNMASLRSWGGEAWGTMATPPAMGMVTLWHYKLKLHTVWEHNHHWRFLAEILETLSRQFIDQMCLLLNAFLASWVAQSVKAPCWMSPMLLDWIWLSSYDFRLIRHPHTACQSHIWDVLHWLNLTMKTWLWIVVWKEAGCWHHVFWNRTTDVPNRQRGNAASNS